MKINAINYDQTKYKIKTWKNPAMLHWIINPGLVINELVLGQRIPKVMLIERDSNKSLVESTLIPCPHCGVLHSGLKWTMENKTAFQNWFGLFCDNCGKIIPCLTNLTSCIILIVTFPVWFWFKDHWKMKWLEIQKIKFAKPLTLTCSESNILWWRSGLIFGLFLYVFMEVLYPLISGKGITPQELLIGIPLWTCGGLVYGYMMKKMTRKKQSEND